MSGPFHALLSALDRGGVRYVLIGVAGVNYHAGSAHTMFTTRDRDLFIPLDWRNTIAAWSACESAGFRLYLGDEPLGAPLDQYLAERIVQLRALVQATDHQGTDIDLTMVMGAFDFETVWRSRTTFVVSGTSIPVARLTQIVESKAFAGRPKDQMFLASHQDALRRMIDAERTAPLIEAIAAEARREPFAVDLPVYEEAGRDPSAPILFAGSLESPVAFLGRDLGREEVLSGEPLIGAAGRQVRGGCGAAGIAEPLLTNIVPFKPPGNKAYPQQVVRRFQPLVARLLVECWRGELLVTLGNRAFDWLRPWHDGLAAFWADEARRYRDELLITLAAGEAQRTVRVAPLPHPSPLNARWFKAFPELLATRLAGLDRSRDVIP